MDFIPEPPHCPVDRIILEKLGDPRNWTQLDDIKEYQEIIESIRKLAGDKSPSEWENDEWLRDELTEEEKEGPREANRRRLAKRKVILRKAIEAGITVTEAEIDVYLKKKESMGRSQME
jgi:hypothetical protein